MGLATNGGYEGALFFMLVGFTNLISEILPGVTYVQVFCNFHYQLVHYAYIFGWQKPLATLRSDGISTSSLPTLSSYHQTR